MDFDDIFENKYKYHEDYRGQRCHDENRYPDDLRRSNHGHDDHFNWLNILEKIRGNKKLKLLVIIAAILILAAASILIIVLWPLIIKLYNYIIQNGLQGVLTDITNFLDKIMKGSGK